MSRENKLINEERDTILDLGSGFMVSFRFMVSVSVREGTLVCKEG